MRRRIMVAVSLLALLNVYAAARIIARWPWAQAHLVIMGVVVLAFFILQLVGPFGDRLLFPRLKKDHGATAVVFALDWASYVAFGVMSFLLIYGLATDLVSIAWQLFASQPNMVDFDQRALQVLGVLTVGTVVVGVFQAHAGPRVRRVEVPLRNLPASFDGFKIAQISDLHVGPTIGREYTQNVVNITNGLQPDLVALTGDFIDGSVADLAAGVAPIGGLKAPQGVFFVTGNHEFYWDAFAWMGEFKRLGAHVLFNSHQVIRQGDGEIILAGVSDYSTRGMSPELASDPHKSLTGAPTGLIKILLAHQPASYIQAHEAGFDLQLSGHTHAGQYFPFSLFIRFFQKFYKGLNRYESMWIYVNSGTGYWGPPLRAGVPSEITLITLRSERV